MKMKKCKWLAEFEGICCNADSKYVADNPPFNCKCESKDDCKYYEIEEKTNE